MFMKNNGKRSSLILAALITALMIGAAVLVFFYAKGKLKKAAYPIAYTDEFTAAAERYGLDKSLVAALICTESRFRSDAVSGDGAVGLMQLLPSTAEWIAMRRGLDFTEERLYDPETNLDYGCWLLSWLLERYNGSERNALIAYNAGVGRLDEWLKSGADENDELTEIPFAETRNYVQRITMLKEKYGEVYAKELGIDN